MCVHSPCCDSQKSRWTGVLACPNGIVCHVTAGRVYRHGVRHTLLGEGTLGHDTALFALLTGALPADPWNTWAPESQQLEVRDWRRRFYKYAQPVRLSSSVSDICLHTRHGVRTSETMYDASSGSLAAVAPPAPSFVLV